MRTVHSRTEQLHHCQEWLQTPLLINAPINVEKIFHSTYGGSSLSSSTRYVHQYPVGFTTLSTTQLFAVDDMRTHYFRTRVYTYLLIK